jgi:16S rRNA (guanine1207-N2)-methyltransferase
MNKKSYLPYEQVKQFQFKLCNDLIMVVSKPGLPDWDQILPSTELLAEYPRFLPTDHVLLFGSHQGALSVFIARRLPLGRLSVIDNNYTVLEMIRKTLEINDISSVNLITDIELPQVENQSYDAVIIQIPKGRKLSRRWFLQAYRALKIGGSLFIAGSNKSGIHSCIRDASEICGNVRILAYKKGCRISQLIKVSEHSSLPDWAHSPGIAQGTWVEFPINLSNHFYTIRSLPGVFSFDHLDAGTEMLLNVTNIPPGGKVLDLGCGYGIIGLFAATHAAGWIDLVDNDLLAIASCKQTLTLNGITNASIFMGDLLDPVDINKYDLILSNPPFHAGQAVDYQIAEAMIRQSFQALIPEGQIIIVANRFIPYDRLIKEIFGNVSCQAESRKFHVLSANKSR